MTSNRPQTSNSNRQKIIAGVTAVIFLVILWQIIGMFRDTSSSSTATTATNTKPAVPAVASVTSKATPAIGDALSPREKQLLKLQEETQTKYLMALNELQLLKISRDIAEANQAISTAKLNTVENQKKILDAVAPPTPTAPATYAKNLGEGANLLDSEGGAKNQIRTNVTNQDVVYNVISVSQLKNTWSAVIGADGNLYNVQIGDVLPIDGSKVVSIDKSGVVLSKKNQKKKFSLVPII